MSDLRKRIAQLPPDKQVLFRQWLEEKSQRAAAPRTIPRRSGKGPVPLSFAQQRLWFLDRFEPGTATYNMPSPVRLRGALNLAALAAGLDELVRRHETLRTTFHDGQGVPVQRIAAPAGLALPVIDLRGVAGEREAERLSREEATAPFDLARGPLIRVRLVRLAAEDHLLLVNLHHIVTDGWSVGVLMREIAALYGAFSQRRPSPLPELPVQYADFALWQREWLRGEVLAAQLRYWREQLGGPPPLSELPTDRPRPAVQTFRGASLPLELSAELSAGLRELSGGHGVTLFMTLLAAFKVLLFRLSGHPDVAVGTPVAGRTWPEIEGLIGFFLNTLVLRTDLSGHPSFAAVLDRIRRVTLDGFAHQDVPFEKLLEELRPERDLSRTPLFQVFFNMLTLPVEELRLPGLEADFPELPAMPSKFDLTVYLSDRPEGVRSNWVYNADLFDRERMASLLAQYASLLAQIAADPEAEIDRFDLVTRPAEAVLPDPKAALSDRWEGPVTAAFAAQARRRAECAAVVDRDGSRSYGELEVASNRLAHYLRARRLEPGDLVAIYGHRSAALAWAVMGVLKAGAAFVVLDPEDPPRRLVETLRRAAPRGWLQCAAAGELPAEVAQIARETDCRLTLPRLFTAAGELAALPSTAPEVGIGPRSRAYVAFTSGSTGVPKGIVGEHGPLSHFLAWHGATFALNAADRFSMLSGLGHDPLLRDLLTPLWLGATLVIPDPDQILTPGWLAGWIRRQAITVAHLTPAMARLLCTPGRDADRPPPALRYLFLGGDTLLRQDLSALRQFAPEAACVNFYGATETPQAMGFFVVPAAGDPAAERRVGRDAVPLGRGIADVQLLILNPAGGLAGIGEKGEISVRTPFLAAGYLDDPELTRERFPANPFSAAAGDRIYRTGDLGRYLPDGNVEFLGRADHQVKIRGFRVELEEIEATLVGLPGVAAAAVAAYPSQPGDLRLVAYLVPEGEGVELTGATLRPRLRARLPEHMVPAAFVTLAALPLTPRRKVDRAALPAPEWERPAAGAVAPRTPAEEFLAAIWAEVLGLPRVGVEDDFFELGGHSLVATRVISRLRQPFGVELPVRTLFEAPTVAALAERIANAQRAAPAAVAAPIAPVPREGRLRPSLLQERLWFLDQLEPGAATYNIPAAVRLRGVLDLPALAGSLNAAVRRHESLRTTFENADGIPVQVIAPSAGLALPVVDLQRTSGTAGEREVTRWIREETATAFDLARGPLIRVRLLRRAADEHVLLLNLHHVVADAWSMGVLIRELAALYQALAEGRPSPLPPLPIQYADFAHWQREWLRGEVLEAQLSYWRRQLAGEPPPIDLPTDRPRPAVQTYRGERLELDLPAPLAAALGELSRSHGATLFMTLLAAFKVLLHRLTGQDDIVVGSPIAGRTRPEIEDLIGFFLNSLVLRTDLGGNPSFSELLSRVREVTLEAYAHQDVPFEKLLAELEPQRDLSRTPLFQVFFNMLNVPAGDLRLPGLELTPLPLPELPSKFDLTVYLTEQPAGIHTRWVYNADLFDRRRIAHLVAQYESLLTQIVADPSAGIGRLSLRTPQAEAVLPDPRAALDGSWRVTVTAAFAVQAHRRADHPAVVDADGSRSYRELDAGANRLAHRLRAGGVGPGDLVAIYGHRSAALVEAVLGVLKAGAAFLILDPDYPSQRLLACLRLAAPRAWLRCAAAGEPAAEVAAYAASLPLDLTLPRTGAAAELGEPPSTDFGVENAAADRAYVAFTSGSTGVPKGIVGTHGPLGHFLAWHASHFDLTPGDRFSMLSGLGHDPLLRDVLTPLWLGATLVIPDPGEIATPGWLADWMRRQEITVVHLTPAMARLLLSGPAGPPAVALRYLFLGGDTLRRPDVEALGELAPGATCVNFYGATETPQAIAWHAVPGERCRETVPLGRGIADVQLLLLAPGDQPAGIGEKAEICVRTPYLAAGYLDNPELTRERFVPNPVAADPVDRLYRTGDLGRYLPDGEVEFLGRADHQVKIRGFRVELAEIEAALVQLPAVGEAVVVAREHGPGDRRLVAYLVAAPGARPAAGQLRQRLRERLPEYMVPAAFVTLEALPLAPNGKVDRAALPDPETAQEPAEAAPPRDPREELIAELWRELLGVRQVGRGSNFFDLGGHSLLATQLISRLRRVFAVELPVRTLFEAPTVAALAARVAAAWGPQAPTLQPRTMAGDPPASFAQERLWLIDQVDADSTAYNLPAAIRWRGRLEWSAMTRAIAGVVRRHAVLRTRFAQRDGEVVQIISPRSEIAVPLVDLQALPAPLAEATARRLARREARRPFDLARGPLLRIALLRLAADDHLVFVNQHHVVTDGWSIGIFVRETAALYASFAGQGGPAILPPLPIQYADFAAWQRGWLRGATLTAELAWWRQRLAGAPALLDLPTDRPRPTVLSSVGSRHRRPLYPALTTALERLARQRGATLFMALLAGFYTVLYRYTAAEDLLVGSPIANRNREEIEGLIGFFVNTLVLRADLSGAPSFAELLERVRQVALEAYEHQDLPFEKLVGELRPERSLAHSPLFQVMFALQNLPFEPVELPGLTLAPEAVEAGREPFDLTVLVRPAAQRATWSYRRDLFDGTTVARMAGHWEHLLAAAAADPERPIGELPLLSPGEHSQLLVEWNDTALPSPPPEATLHRRFAARAGRTPERIALVCDPEQLSYGELDRRANALARHLRGLGVGPEVRVGICLGRSSLIPIAMLAVFKAGGTLVPLDPQYPPQRLRLVLADSTPRVLVTEDHRAAWLQELAAEPAELVRLDREPLPWIPPRSPLGTRGDAPAHPAGAHPAGPADLAGPENVLYLVYTSGSTGRPKGIEIPHRVMLNLFDWHLSALLGGARVLQFAHLGFDLSYYEMFSAWLSGGTACLVSDEVRHDAGELARYLAAQRIEKVVLPVVVLHQLAEEYAAGRPLPAALREFTSTAEQLVVTPAVRDLFHRLGGCQLVNQYGPSECHEVSWHVLLARPDEWPVRPPIGRPIGGVRLYLADDRCHPVPVGVPGEVLIGGPCVARGYRRRPGRTAERFVPDPWGEAPGGRLYRTGDLARRLPDGQLEFLGRIDFQVKVRGFRVELGEIEEVLGEHPGVRQWVVVAHEGAGGETQLVAYVVPEGPAPPSAAQLRAFLAERLPEPMVPAAWVFLDALPVDANGKVDRRALPAPERPAAAADYAPPRNPTEELVAEIWRELLEFDDGRVGIHDNFFELGGHSLLATRVVSRLRAVFGVEVAVRALFEGPTVAALAREIAAARHAPHPAPPLVPSAEPGPAPASFAQERLWFIDRLQPGSAAYHLPAAFRWRGPLDHPALAAAVVGLWRRHAALRTRFARRRGRLVQVVAPPQAPPAEVALPAVDLQGLGASAAWTEARRLAREEAVRPFDLARGPLVRTAVVRLAPDDHLVVVTQHHVVSDGWSLGILVRELTALYLGASPLAPLPVQYPDFARWQRGWLHGEVLEAELAYWRRRLAGAPELLELPTDRPRPPVLTTTGGRCGRLLPPPLAAAAERLGREHGATLFMTLLAVFKTLLYRYGGQTDLSVGTPIAGRSRPEIEGLIGFFVNTLVLRTDVAGEPRFCELLARVREVALEAFEHQDLPFEKLVEELQPQRSLSHSPLFQVMFALQNAPGEQLALPGVGLEPVGTGTGQAQFDLTLSIQRAVPSTQDSSSSSFFAHPPSQPTLVTTWTCRRDLFDATTIARMAGHFEHLLAAVAADPEASIAGLPLVSPGERSQLLIEWNATAARPATATLDRLFAAQRRRTPQRIALVWEGPDHKLQRWSYDELGRRADRLAGRLRRLGVGPEVRVAVLMERRPELVMALLAVLAAGGAYVPIDPAYPRERVAFMLADSAAAVLLTEQSLAPPAPTGPGAAEVVHVDREPPAADDAEPPRPTARPANLAYLIYTSGSTGRPKGVAIEHRSAVALVDWLRDPFPEAELAGVLASTSICFDLSIFEIFGPLAWGGAVILTENALHLPELAASGEVTLINTVPSAMAQLLRLPGGLPPSVRTVNLAGEPLSRTLVEQIYGRATVAGVWNLYGPSEDTTYSTFVRVPPGEEREPTIGRPVAGTRAFVLDRRLQPVPVGIPGRLYLGGAGLARGYHRRPATTAERWIPDPQPRFHPPSIPPYDKGGRPHPPTAAGGARLYDTGDLARLRPDGELEFLGRVDRQIKLRGFRIELGEIETALAALPGIAEAAVTALGPSSGADARLVAYLAGDAVPAAGQLRAALRQRLPEHLVPATFVALAALPRTPNGKVDWAALPAPEVAEGERPLTPPPGSEWEERVAAIWRRVLGVEQIGVDDNFFDLGGHSLLLVEVHEQLRTEWGRELPVVRLFQYPTVRSLAAFLGPERAAPGPRPAPTAPAAAAEVAIVGLALRFPGADSPQAFWANLRDGVESVTFFSRDELLRAGVAASLLADPAYVPAAAVLDRIEDFDAAFFGYSPLEAATIDPQQRIFLEVAWEALERAGYDTLRYPGRIGVFAGVGMNTYAWNNLATNPELMASLGGFQVMFSNDKDFLTTRASYKLDLRGPSVVVQTACSTSLVAVHLACQSLLAGECEMALAGGVTVRVPQRTGYLYQEGTIVSPDGHCRPFDAAAAGTISGSGAGIVVLKRLADAVADGDSIHAVIRGSAINNDGAVKVGYSAPSVEGQAKVIADALAQAGVGAETVDFVECHGTATPLGDPIEVAALDQVYGRAGERQGACALGSVKSNFGHLDAAAGVAGLIKAVLALEHGQIPPSLYYREPNPAIDFTSTPLQVSTRLAEWPRHATPRRAGVSSFGLGGTNAHAVLEEAPVAVPASAGEAGQWQLLVLSARSAAALDQATAHLATHLERHCDGMGGGVPPCHKGGSRGDQRLLPLDDVAFTLQLGRRAFEHRRIAVCADLADAARVLAGDDPPRLLSAAVARDGDPRVVFMFSGQGSQHAGMGRGLYENEPLFRREVDRGAELMAGHLGRGGGVPPYHKGGSGGDQTEGVDLRRLIYPPPGEEGEAAHELDRIELGQPALFVVEHALARLWMAWGIRPAAMIGHSVGEYVAAALAGIMTLEDAAALVAARSTLMARLPVGRMLSVPLPEAEIAPLLGDELSLGAVNAPSQCVVSGPEAAIAALDKRLREQGLEPRVLRVGVAGHSALMEEILDPYREEVTGVALRPPRIPFVSNLTGTWIEADQATDPEYWVRHLRHTVRFAAGIGELLADRRRILLEVGPGRALATLARQDRPEAAGRVVVHSLPHPREEEPDAAFFLTALGRLWLAGVEVDWPAVHGEKRRRVALPTYPFERQRCWIEPRVARVEGGPLRRRAEVGDWFYQPSWRRTPLPAPAADEPGCWLVLADRRGLGERITARLRDQGHRVTTAVAGTRFSTDGDEGFTLDPAAGDDYRRLLAALAERDAVPERVLHLWGLDPLADPTAVRDRGFYSLLFLAQAVAGVTDPIAVGVAATGLWEVNGGEALRPEQATVLGPCRVIPQEYPNLSCRCFDLLPDGDDDEWLGERLIAELGDERREAMVAYRGRYRWVQHFEPVPARTGSSALRPRDGGVYLITGGLGRVGRVLAEALARGARDVKLVLTGRRELPARERWDEILEGGAEEELAARIRGLREIEALGAEVLPQAADAADRQAMGELVTEVRRRFGALNGVIHAAALIGGPALVPVGTANRETCEAQFGPKITGARLLAELLGDGEPDFCMLVSSLSTVLGGLGFAAYSAANHFLDALAQERSRRSPFPWVSVGWEAWRFAAEEETPPTALGAAVLELAVRPDEGRAAMEHLFALDPAPQILISTADLGERAAHWEAAAARVGRAAAPEVDAGAPPASAVAAHPRPELQVAYVAPRDRSEGQIAGVWSELLGIGEIGVHDNFFELGGHSVVATQVVARLRRELGREVPLETFFAHPTVAALAAALAGEGPGAEPFPAAATSIPRLPRTGQGDGFPLSFAQERFWFLDQLEPGNPAYHVPLIFGLRGDLRVAALGRALDGVTRRHESLRTTFTAPGGEPVQVVGPPRACPLPVIDLRALAPAARERERRRLAFVEGRLPFDLAREPQLRTRLLRLAAEDWVLIGTMHHIATDFWSMGLLMQEVARLYQAFHRGEQPSLPELPIQYPDFAVWQREWLQGGVFADQMRYWTQTLDGAPTVLELPTDRPRPRRPSFRGASLRLVVGDETMAPLDELARRQGATTFMTLLAAFGVVLHRWSGQDEILVGTPAANRPRAELEGLIGLFVNNLVLRLDLTREPTFLDLLARVRETVLGAQAHQDLPFEQLVDELQPERHLARAPLFQVQMVLQTAPVEAVRMPGLSFRMLASDVRTTLYDLSLNLTFDPPSIPPYDKGGRPHPSQGTRQRTLRGLVQFNPDLFDTATIRRFLGHFRRLLAAVPAHPTAAISQLPVLTAGQRWQLLGEWNDTAVDYREGRCLHRLIAAQVARTPDATAVVFAHHTLSYRELDRRAGLLARSLRQRGVGPDVLVGVFMERSLELVVALLGILKAGGAYLPLDPSYPRERLAFMVRDAGCPVLLTQERLLSTVPPGAAQVIPLDVPAETAAGTEPEPERDPDPDHLAYAIYTSGSTGQPKGSLISHRAIVNRLLWMQETYGLRPGEGVLQKTPFSFDVSVWEFFWPLIVGARLVVARPGGHQDGAYLAELICRQEVTTLHFVPSMLQAFVDEPRLADCRCLRRVIASGEALPRELRERFAARSQAELHNLYGPTEAAVDVTFWPCDSAPRRSMPIGRPIANLRIHLLDRRGEPVAVGEVGELHIAGRGLARGYLRRPALSAECFLPDPFSGAPGGRLYRTGDLARYFPDGAIEFLGRRDHQVKVRGFRIELGEIEIALGRHPAVGQAVVVMRDQRLVAYLVPRPDAPAPLPEDLRAFLTGTLPEYMVPSLFVVLEALPLTPSGKVDRRALPAPSGERPELREAYVAPRNPAEEQLAAIWCEVLGLERVGVRDNFFQIGGHSLLATQVVSRVRQDFGVELPLAALFEGPTIAQLAEAFWEQQIDTAGDDLAALLAEIDGLSDEEAERLTAEPRDPFLTPHPPTPSPRGAAATAEATRTPRAWLAPGARRP